LEEILKKEILFILPVNDYAITKGFWQKISKAIPLEPHLERLALTPMFWQNPIRPNHFRLVYSDKIVEASAKECVGLERWAVWTPESIEQRLRDYYEGKENFYVQRNKEAWALASAE